MNPSQNQCEIKNGVCLTTQTSLTQRPARPYPVVPQVLFGVSFLAFILFQERIAAHRMILWGWSALQIALGIWLMRGRVLSRRRVSHCVRCGRDIP